MNDAQAVRVWMEAMRRGNFSLGWNISDLLMRQRRVQDRKKPPRCFQMVWDGSSVKGKRVLVACFHGLGDTIQFIRYAALLKEVAAEVIVWAQPSLIALLRTVKGIDQLLPLYHGMPNMEYDIEVELGELPYVFRTTLGNIPAQIPYILVQPAPLERKANLQVGLIWQSGRWNPRRSVPFSKIQRLAQVPGIDWHIMQHDPWGAGWDGKLGVISGGDYLWDDARVMRALDLVITVDTMTAHLAGALGQQTWTLLPFNADWRWLLRRNDSPWYPTMRLFRQRKQGRWEALIDEVASELKKLGASHIEGLLSCD